MSQHDYAIANGSGSAIRTDLNNALGAIVTTNSGASAPSSTFAYQLWADTTADALKIRNAANSAWITVGTLSATNLGLLSLAGGTMTGALTTNGQVAFPASQNPSADANTLDDYEEGTWTPSVGGTATYTTQSGTYTKIGRLVHISCRLTINALGTGSTGIISGLPFTNAVLTSLAVAFWANAASSLVFVGGLIGAAATTINVVGNTAASSNILNPATFFGNGADISLTGCYHV